MGDLRFGWRTLWRSPGFTLVAVLILALNIGLGSTMVEIVRTVLFNQLPFDAPDRILAVWRQSTRHGPSSFSIPTFEDLIERNRSFEALAMVRFCDLTFSEGAGEPELIPGKMVSAEFLDVLGVRPALGRGFTSEDDRLGAELTVLLSHELWQRRFGEDRNVLGRGILLGGQIHTVIGVLPAGLSREPFLHGPMGDFLVPIRAFYDRLPVNSRDNRPDIWGIGRLADGYTLERSRQDLSRLSAEFREEFPKSYATSTFVGVSIREHLTEPSHSSLRTLAAAVALVLVISAANLLNLVLTRLTLRLDEFLTRVALGADRGRLLRQLLSEGLCLYALSGVAGLLFSVFFLRLAPIILNDLPYIERVSFSFPTLILTLVLTLAFALVVALVPAGAVLRKIGGHHALLSGRVTVSNRRLRKVLVLVELGLALVAFIGSTMLLKSLAQIQNEDLGFSTENVLTMQVVLPQWKHNEEIPWVSFFDEFEERLAGFPDVESVGVAAIAPFSEHNASIVAAGDRALLPTPEMATASYNVVSEGYFHTLDIPLIEGRLFDQRDSNRAESERVVVISESLARYLWPERSSIGKRFSFEFLGTAESPEPHWRRIIGVVGDARDESLGAPPGFAAYASYGQRPIYSEGAESPPMILMIETGEPSATLLDRVRAEIRALDPSLPIKNVQTLAEAMDATLRERRVVTYLLSCFAGLAFILALIGLYGVTSYTLETMRQEIGVRMALGAAPRRILGELLRESLTTILIGIALGLLAAVSLPSVLSKWLYGVRPIEPSLFLLGALTVAVVALLATLAPALRASRLTIVEVLRHE